jgi:hypothetical protein
MLYRHNKIEDELFIVVFSKRKGVKNQDKDTYWQW